MAARFNLRKWTLDGRQLANPLTILRRAITFPLLWAVRALYFLVVLFGWGWDEAADVWGRMP